VRFDLELAVAPALAGAHQDRADLGTPRRQHVGRGVADHPAAMQVEVELLLRHLVDARAGLAEHALLAEAPLALGVERATVDLRDRDLLLLHAPEEHLAEAGEVAFLLLAEGDVAAAGGDEDLEPGRVDAAERLEGVRQERDLAVRGQASLGDDDAIEFEEQALLVGDLGHGDWGLGVGVGAGGCRLAHGIGRISDALEWQGEMPWSDRRPRQERRRPVGPGRAHRPDPRKAVRVPRSEA
jgi:hypothetical protein